MKAELKRTRPGAILVGLPEDILKKLNLTVEDEMDVIYNDDGSNSFTIKKHVEDIKPVKQVYLIETLSVFRHQFLVEVPRTKKRTHSQMKDFIERQIAEGNFSDVSQEHLSEKIIEINTTTLKTATEYLMSRDESLSEEIISRHVNRI